MATKKSYRTLEEIRDRKLQLSEELNRDTTKMGLLWGKTFVKREDATKGEYITSMINNGIMAFDAFMLIRKLRRDYNTLFGSRKKSKKR